MFLKEFKSKLILLHHCKGIGWKSIFQILQNDPQLQSLFQKSLSDWKLVLPQIHTSNLTLFYQNLHTIDIQEKIKQYTSNNIIIKTIFEEDYPIRLKHIYNPPWVLYMKGNINLLHQDKILSVVGPRKPSEYGKAAADFILPGLLSSQYVIVSGLAIGIDACAHKIAIHHGGATIGVLGGGLFHIYPKENTSLAIKMMNDQLVLSETPPFEKAAPWMFPLRNRIISGISDGVFIIEAKQKSGSLITAYQALEQGKDVFALPGNIFNSLSVGTNLLVQDGAKLVMTHMDIVNEYS
jgi:DNA processing protein